MNTLKEFMVKIGSKFDASGFNKMRAETAKLKGRLSSLREGLNPLRDVVVGVGFGSLIKQAVDFETHMSGVAKQIQGARDASGELTKTYYDMQEQIRTLAKTSPISQNDIADIVTAGARMGVANDELIGFTQTAIKMSTAFEAPASELADQMGKIANVFKMPIKNVDDLADSINYLDDNAISKGADIINVLQRTGGTAGTVGLTAKEVAALGSTFLSMGKAPEVASTAINSLITTLSTLDASKIGKAGDDFAKLGLTTKGVQQMFSKDAQGAIDLVLTRLSKLNKSQRILASTNIFGRQFGDDIVTVAGNMQEYHRQLELANGAAARGSMQREYETRLKTTAAQLQILKNNLTDVAITLGNVFLPGLVDAAKAVAPIAQGLNTWSKEHPTLIKYIGLTVLSLAGLSLAMFGITTIFGGLRTAWIMLTTVASAFRFVMLGVNAVMYLNPAVWIIAGIIALGAAVYAIIKYWDELKLAISGAWDALKGFFGFAKNSPNIKLQSVAATMNPYSSAGISPTSQQASNISNAVTNSRANSTNVTAPINNNNTYNITGNNPEAIAKQIANMQSKQNRSAIANSTGFATAF